MKAIRNIILAGCVLLGAASCTKNFEAINTNPNTLLAGQVKAYNYVEPIIYGLGRSAQQYAWYWNNELVQVTAATGTNARTEHTYNVQAANFQTFWDLYARYGFDCDVMARQAIEDGDDFLHGVGLVMKAYCLDNLCTLFGDIPYDEAYKRYENLTPAFESQEEAYGHIIRDLDSASVIFSRGAKPLKSGLDGIYNGSPSAWRKYANSLKMSILCRMASIDAKYWTSIQQMIDNPEANPVFESNSDNAEVKYQVNDPYKSYFGVNNTPKGDFNDRRLCEQIVKMMVIRDADENTLYVDPRLPIWSNTNSEGKWVGTISGASTDEKTVAEKRKLCTLNFNTLCRADFSGFLMEYSEILFIEAEGVLAGKLTMAKTARELYEAAVRASVEKWAPYVQYNSKPKSVKSSDIDALLASNLCSWDKAGTEGALYGSQEELLLSQKWLSMFFTNFKQFNEWRRTEYPRIVIGNGTITNNYEYPTRFAYPNYTESSNKDNVAKALQRMGGENDMHTALDWSYKKNHNLTHRDPYEEHTI